MYFDIEELKKASHNWERCTENQLIEMLQGKINWLSTHNKNYTNNQYFLILDIKEILNSLKTN